MVAVWLINRSHDDMAFVYYIIALSVISFLTALTIKDKHNQPLD